MMLRADKRGSVALMTGIMAPVLVMSLALGIEVTSWSVSTVELQRAADVAAWAGAMQYAASSNAQTAAQVAADVAEINGVSGAASRIWNAGTSTLTDNLITVQLVTGVRNASDNAVKVSAKQSIAKIFSLIFSSTQPSVTVSAAAVAEIGSLGPQPCITALGGGTGGITTGTDVSVVGNATLDSTNCALRSNAGISENGGGTINVSGVYAGGNISGSGICCDLHANAGQIQDPYANNAAVQNALKSLSPGTGTPVNVGSNRSQPIGPGTYSGWSVSGTLNLSPGLYIVNGDISATAQSVISGTGVTIVTSGVISTVGGSSLALTAAKTDTTGNAIPGVLIAGSSSGTMSFLGNSNDPVTGLIYLPNATLKFGGTSSLGSDGCTEVIASTVTLIGTSDLNAAGTNCAAYGLLSFGSLPSPAPVALVQ
jgi:Flp pilus assembly protein TadG